MKLGAMVRRIPVLGRAWALWRDKDAAPAFSTSGSYWEERYARGGNSGAGSYNRLAEFKAEYLNRFVSEHEIKTVIEFGSGDGGPLRQASYPA